jgi:hypothetical protein
VPVQIGLCVQFGDAFCGQPAEQIGVRVHGTPLMDVGDSGTGTEASGNGCVEAVNGELDPGDVGY